MILEIHGKSQGNPQAKTVPRSRYQGDARSITKETVDGDELYSKSKIPTLETSKPSCASNFRGDGERLASEGVRPPKTTGSQASHLPSNHRRWGFASFND